MTPQLNVKTVTNISSNYYWMFFVSQLSLFVIQWEFLLACGPVFQFFFPFYCSCFRVIWRWSPISGVTWFSEWRGFFFFLNTWNNSGTRNVHLPLQHFTLGVVTGGYTWAHSSFSAFAVKSGIILKPSWCLAVVAFKQDTARTRRATEGLNIQRTILILLKLFLEVHEK